MRTITLFDTSAASDNIGDTIIVDAVTAELSRLMPDAYTYTVATHEYMSSHSRDLLRKSSAAFVAGTNILSSNMETRLLWKVWPWDALAFSETVLVGCGWLWYMKKPNAYSRWFLGRVLSNTRIHAVRDSYTLSQLSGMGKRVLNTSCPTMWSLTPEHCSSLPTRKTSEVVATLTCYSSDREGDRKFIELLQTNYSKVSFFPQQREDLAYFESLGLSGVSVVDPSLRAYNNLLDNPDIEFVGTRLHGGIRALQKGRRALIIAIDNRAKEISRDTGLPTVARGDLGAIEDWINGDRPTVIKLPEAAIREWRGQFQ
jgi:polysaccharide pyruvyl transferase WcaK-like protein